MIRKIKWLAVAVGLLAALALGFLLRGGPARRAQDAAEVERAQLQAELQRLSQRLSLAETDLNQKRKEVLTLRDKGSGRPVSPPPADCARCFEKIRLSVEVRDEERGWWIYRDRDVMDREPGELTLTPRFWEEIQPAPRKEAGLAQSPVKPKRWKTEKEIRAGVSLSGYEAGFEFSPLVLSGRRWQARLFLGSRLELNRLDQTLHANLSAGIGFRW